MYTIITLSLAIAQPFPHQEQLTPAPLRSQSKTEQYTSPNVTVYGYHPYWGGDPLGVDLSPLTHMAIFNVGMDINGQITNTAYWHSAAGNLVTKAHAMGVKIHLCLASFSDTVNNAVLPNPTKRALAAEQLATLVNTYGADGVNIDIEGMDATHRENLTLFTAEIAALVPEVVLATPAVDWSNAYDYSTLASISDGLFLMGYDYHWAGGNPGPVDPLFGGSPWSQWALDWSVQDHLSKGVPAHKLILGIALYGRRWDTLNSNVPGSVSSNGNSSSATMSTAVDEANLHGSLFDAVTRTPYLLYPNEQLWFGDIESVRERIHYASEQELQGIGFWALSYENGVVGFWDMVNEETVNEDPIDEPNTDDTAQPTDTAEIKDIVTPDTPQTNQAPIANAGQNKQVIVGKILTLSGALSSDPDGDTIYYSWRQLSGPTSVIVGGNTATPEITFTEVGTNTYELSISDGELYATPDTVKVTVVAPDQSVQKTSCQSSPIWIPLWLCPLCILRRSHFQTGKPRV